LNIILSSPPILAYPDFDKPFELHTDVSILGLGAILYQKDGNHKRVVAYASRSLSKSERKYSAFKLEFLASFKLAITENARCYLAGKHFKCFTDNNPLTHIRTSPKLDAKGQRWAAALGEFDFELFYRPGTSNVDEDALSRYPYQKDDDDEEERIKMDTEVVRTICSALMTSQPLIDASPAMNLNIVEITEDPGTSMAQIIVMREIRRKQMEDPIISKWRIAVIDGDGQVIEKTFTKEYQIMKRNFKSFRMKRSILFREIEENEKKIEQLVVPECYKQDILKGMHTDIGHPGIERTTRLIRQRFFWPGRTLCIENWVKQCDRRKSATNIRAPLININTTYPLESVCFDFLSLETAKGGYSNILVITDHFRNSQ
jgi:hypothetical protein